MAADIKPAAVRTDNEIDDDGGCDLHTFKLYETRSNFYMIGKGKNKTYWRVLKINRLESSELDVCEDSTTYCDSECDDLLNRIHEGNKPTGGLRFVTHCYGIVGFVKFLGPYYMLLITQRRHIGTICGHKIYAITKSRMITVPNSTLESDITDSNNENRYKKLLCSVDLTKDFFFSYSYHIMCSLQNNVSDSQTGHIVCETMFVWNEFLTHGIRNHLKSSIWTVALVCGFFKQGNLSVSGKQFKLTLIARRSRHYAGTRYLKRGVNEKGMVANDVEIEQIVCEDNPGEFPAQITSVVQNRGSIPLYWSQEASRLNLRPDIILEKKDQNYQATKLHFDNLTKRYGSPIIILNLIKTQERKPRESKLRAEFANAIHFINKDLSQEKLLRFLHWDLNRQPRRKAAYVLELLGKVAAYTLNWTGFLSCQVLPTLKIDDDFGWPFLGKDSKMEFSSANQNSSSEVNTNISGEEGSPEDSDAPNFNYFTRPITFQRGVLRTNCIDCLDRTNVAQYAYGLAALGHQLYAVGLIPSQKIDLDSTLADDLVSFYEIMGDTLAVQYTGSAAHNKIFSERRGHWKAAIQSQEFLRTLQRYYSNAYMDAQKQDAIDLFLGYFQPQKGKASLWDLDFAERQEENVIEHSRYFFRRSLSYGSILHESSTCTSESLWQKKFKDSAWPGRILLDVEPKGISESSPDMSPCDREISYSRYIPTLDGTHIFPDNDQIYFNGHGLHGSDFSNFLDLDLLSSSGNSCEEESYESASTDESLTPVLTTSEPVAKGIHSAAKTKTVDYKPEFSNDFSHWVVNGDTICQ